MRTVNMCFRYGIRLENEFFMNVLSETYLQINCAMSNYVCSDGGVDGDPLQLLYLFLFCFLERWNTFRLGF